MKNVQEMLTAGSDDDDEDEDESCVLGYVLWTRNPHA